MAKTTNAHKRKKTSKTRVKTQLLEINQEAIRALDAWYNTPRLYDDAFWKGLEQELKQNRMNLRTIG